MSVSYIFNSLHAQEQQQERSLRDLAGAVESARDYDLSIPKAYATEHEIRQAVDEVLQSARGLIEKLKSQPGHPLNLHLMDELFASFTEIGSQLFITSSVLGSPSLKKAADREALRIEEFWVDDVLTDEDLFIELKKIEVAKKRLSEEERAHLEHLLMFFRFYHADEEDDEKETESELERALKRNEHKQTLQNLSKTADRVATEFERNISESKKSILFSTEELEGLPEWFLIETQTPEGTHQIEAHIWWQYSLVMRSAKRASTRKKVETARESIAQDTNLSLIETLLVTKDSLAREMGLESWLQHQLVELSISSEVELRKFLAAALQGNKAAFKAEQAIITKWKKRQTRSSNPKIFASDWRYYLAQELEHKYAYTDEEARQYFSYDRVLQAVLRKHEKVSRLKIEVLPAPEGWPEEVQTLLVSDKHGKLVGAIVLDPFPREGKDAWFFNMGLKPRRLRLDGRLQLPTTLVNLNFPPPTSERPSLLYLDDVVTLHHELGHALHDVRTEMKFSTIAGTASYEDLVETPSALMETWVDSKDFIRELSSHYQTGAPLPEVWVENWDKIVRMGSAHELQRRLMLASIDVQLHGLEMDPSRIREDDLRLRAKHFYAPPSQAEPLASTSYFSGGYDGLMWIYPYGTFLSAVLIEELFEGDPFNERAAAKYHRELQSVGGMRHTATITKRLLGKNFNPCAAALSHGRKEGLR